MSALRFLTSGESHGPALTGILEGMPAGLRFDEDFVNHQLWRRQQGYGRSGRQKIEQDRARVLGGVNRAGLTTGGPIALQIENRDWANWKDREVEPLTVPRPGHADLTGRLKYGFGDMRDALERASARETAMRVALCSVARLLLRELGVEIGSYVVSLGEVRVDAGGLEYEERFVNAEASEVRSPVPEQEEALKERIRQAARARDTVGGVFEVVALGVPPGWGGYAHWEHRLNARLAYAVMSIQAIKGVEIGAGFRSAEIPGTRLHDEIFLEEGRVVRRTNNAGGIEGGISNGQPIVVRAAMKPISTTLTPRRSVDMATGEETENRYERSDICAVPAAAVVGEAMVAWALAQAAREKYGGDSMEELLAHFRASQEQVEARLRPPP